MRHVILGNGAAGLSAARTLRALRPDDEIVMVSDEPHLTYSRCLLADYVGGEVSRDRLWLHPESYYAEQRIELMLGRWAVRIDHERRMLIMETGKPLGYDRLLIAAGAVASFPPLPGIQDPRIVALRTLNDADAMIELTRKSERAVVLGGGYIGLEAAHALRRRGLNVTVLEMMPHVLYTYMDETAAGIISDDLRDEGVIIRTGEAHQVMQIESERRGIWPFRKSGALHFYLRSGEVVEADMAVCATGVRSSLELVRGTPIRADAGILVDDYLQTSAPGIYAAGDVVQARDLISGERRTTPIWPNAVAQGKLAAYNMAGIERRYSGEIGLQNAVEFRQVPAIAFGLSKAGEAEGYEVRSVYRPDRREYRKVVFEGDVIRGMIYVGDISHAGVVTSLLKREVPLGALKEQVLDPSFSLAHTLRVPFPETASMEEIQGYLYRM
ncbi:MAG TPA: NAD(P)/FAD-dependent oxidoreductase [Chloroflexi bacterium]|jgi:nitrite reductase (NADH) large subunit|nr:NAD(P)/FAD-dependent oxidoreductase [Chloroflexota bacterium]